ncbi:MAG: CoB--CoM heterodisulfide reductase iron-sulfur subunit A family protein [Candidatus Krumholzibacteriia bacterium]
MGAAELERGSPATLLVIGGGISGLTTAIEAAEVGRDVILVEQNPYLGGRVAQFYHYFPKQCPPSCGLEINFRRIKQNDRIRVLTQAQVTEVSGQAGNYQATIVQQPRYVNERCTACGACAEACDIEIDDPFEYGVGKRKAIDLPHGMAYPYRYHVDARFAKDERLRKAADACEYGAVELDMEPRTFQVTVGAIVAATGWQPYDASKLENLGYAANADVITNVEMERLAAPTGPTAGEIVRPSDGKPIDSIAFVQCAGSRDENHLPFCSGVCCLASMKQAQYVRELYPEADVHVFYIDIRSPGRLEDFYTRTKDDPKVVFHRGKVANVVRKGAQLQVEAEDTLTGKITTANVDMVVLATGMAPQTDDLPAGAGFVRDEMGFITQDAEGEGLVAAGTCTQPLDVACSIQDATGAALKGLLRLGKE